MKLLTKEEEDAHYAAVLKGGAVGGVAGLAGGLAAVMLASRRYPAFNSLTPALKAFLVTSASTFTGIVAADHSSRTFEASRSQGSQFLESRQTRIRREELAQMSAGERVADFARREKYKIIGATWAASIVGSFILVGRNPYLTGQQKIVQARVYAQGLTLAVLCATAALEIRDQRKGQGLLDAVKAKKARQAKEGAQRPQHKERYGGEDLWKEMVEAEEERLRENDAKAPKKTKSETNGS